MRQIRKILRDKRGEGYIDVAVMVLCVMLVIALGVRLFPIFITKMQVDNFADELAREAEISETVVEGNRIAIADFIKNCKEGSIITIHTLDGEPFLIGMSKLFLYCEDNEFLNNQLIPYLRGM